MVRYQYLSMTLDGWIDKELNAIDVVYHPNVLDRLMVRYHCLSMTLDGWMDGWT